MQIIDFKSDHIETATMLVNKNYEQERGFVPACPKSVALPDMKQFADNNLGVAAFENGEEQDCPTMPLRYMPTTLRFISNSLNTDSGYGE